MKSGTNPEQRCWDYGNSQSGHPFGIGAIPPGDDFRQRQTKTSHPSSIDESFTAAVRTAPELTFASPHISFVALF